MESINTYMSQFICISSKYKIHTNTNIHSPCKNSEAPRKLNLPLQLDVNITSLNTSQSSPWVF